jgi:hypothetical protein
MCTQTFKFIIVFALVTLTFNSTSFAQRSTPKYWKCNNKVGGEWDFGQVPNGCDVKPFQSPVFVAREFKDIIFDDNKDWEAERVRYMQEMYAIIRDAAKSYIKRRKPDVSVDEVRNWTRAILATAHQETYWTHYRRSEVPGLKMIRGDFGHGHGMMQVDDRWHFPAIQEGNGSDIVKNLVYAFDEYFQRWEQAPGESCVDYPENWRQRARTAYSAYNGGASKLCRWTNPKDRWAKNDKNWIEKYDAKGWLEYVPNLVYKSKIDIECHMNGEANCYDFPDGPYEGLFGRILVHSAGLKCVIDDDAFQCLNSSEHDACLAEYYHVSPQPINLTKDQEKELPIVVHDVNIFCERAIAGLVARGDVLKLAQNINLRKTPAGQLIKVAKKNTVSEVFDFYVENDGSQDRYYKIAVGDDTGFIYAGDHSDHAKWAVQISQDSVRGQIPNVGDQIKIVNGGGINLRAKIKGKVIGLVPKGQVVEIQDREFRESSGKMYLAITYQGKSGFIYGGQMRPYSVNDWVEKVDAEATKAQLLASVEFAFPRECPNIDCPLNGETISSDEDNKFTVLQRKNNWLKIQKGVAKPVGWIQADMVNEL